MRKSATPSIPLLGGPALAPAVALMEVLVAALILVAASLAFLGVLREARGDLAQARTRAQATTLAVTVLREAKRTWASGPYAGERAGLHWRLRCRASPEAASPRLVLITCSSAVARTSPSEPIVALDSAWMVPRDDLFAP